jgi:hypothetical protein
MPSPRPKRTSNATFQRIVDALEELKADDDAPRTKREIERRSGLAHDAVARAFRQDADEDNEFGINKKFDELTAELTVARVSPDRDKQIAVERQNAELRDQVRHLNDRLDQHAMALFAYHLQETHAARSEGDAPTHVVPIRVRRRDDD